MRERITSRQTYKSIKSGLDTAAKYGDRPMNDEQPLTVKERTLRHQTAHPKDHNRKKENRGVQWAKSKKTQRDKKLNEFYKTHVYTWISNSRRGWVAVPTEEEE